jgi:hypothetical protein
MSYTVLPADESPYSRAVLARTYSRPLHFAGAAEVWEAFAAKQISSKRREELLFSLRARLMQEVPLLK